MTECDQEARALILKRLNRIEGQVRGIRRMIEEERNCYEIMKQVGASAGALHSLGREMLRAHLQMSLTRFIDKESERRKLMDDLLAVLDQFRR